MNTRNRRAALTLAATGLALAGTVVAAQPALAYNCRIVIARDMRYFATSTGSATTPPHELVTNDKFRSYGVSNGRFSALTYKLGYWSAGWVSADGDYTNLSTGCP